MTRAKVMLADVLWEAANECLSSTGNGHYPEEFSCHAVMCAEFGKRWRPRAGGAASNFLESLGCDPGVAGFDDFREGRQRQGVRYMWLLLAAKVAEDEGIEL